MKYVPPVRDHCLRPHIIWPTEAGEESLESLVGERVGGVSLTSVGRTGVVYQLELVETLTRREAGRQFPEK